jgi:hypothetical protein
MLQLQVRPEILDVLMLYLINVLLDKFWQTRTYVAISAEGEENAFEQGAFQCQKTSYNKPTKKRKSAYKPQKEKTADIRIGVEYTRPDTQASQRVTTRTHG